MNTTFFGAAFDARDAARLATFWSEVLGRPVNEGASAEHAAIDATTPELGPRLSFHQVPQRKSVKNRFHPDLISTEFAADSDRLLALGATKVNEVFVGGAHWKTFLDPEGNEFDLIAA